MNEQDPSLPTPGPSKRSRPSGSVSDQKKQKKAKELVLKYHNQLLKGCGRRTCSNQYCASNPAAQRYARQDALKEALRLVKAEGVNALCSDAPEQSYGPQTPEVRSMAAPSSPPPGALSVSYLTLAELQALSATCAEEKDSAKLIRRIGAAFGDPQILEYSFCRVESVDGVNVPVDATTEDSGLDLDMLDEAWNLLENNPAAQSVMNESLRRLFNSLVVKPDKSARILNRARLYALVFENPCLLDPEYHDVLQGVMKAIAKLDEAVHSAMITWWSMYDSERLSKLVGHVQQYITVKWFSTTPRVQDVIYPVQVLSYLYHASEYPYSASKQDDVKTSADAEDLGPSSSPMSVDGEDTAPQGMFRSVTQQPRAGGLPGLFRMNSAPHRGAMDGYEAKVAEPKIKSVPAGCNKSILPYTDFYNDAVNDSLNLKRDYEFWNDQGPKAFAFCQYPFILDPSSKSMILRIDADHQKAHQAHRIMEQLLHGELFMNQSVYFRLEIRRDNLIEDTLNQIINSRSDFKKPLKVKFVNEPGIDEGGVRKEFFQLVVAELFRPGYDMFTYEEETRNFWFNKDTMTERVQFELIGIVLGLAIYNSVILELRFPKVVWKKLVHAKYHPQLEDLADIDPALYKGFGTLLSYEGDDLEDVYDRTFSVEYEAWGEKKTVLLKEDGDKLKLTKDNRQEYVDLYVQWVVDKSVATSFGEFRKGFMKVCGGPAYKLFRPEEVELLVCGNPELDFEALEKSARYEDGYTANSSVIKHFWEIVHSMSDEEKRKLLAFCTGSDRVPIRGLGALPFTISRNGPDSERLPSAHTCFNHLLLPEYSTRQKLEDMLRRAITHAQGFGLM